MIRRDETGFEEGRKKWIQNLDINNEQLLLREYGSAMLGATFCTPIHS